MKLKEGMYVRTNEGIGTVQRIYNNKNDCTVKFKKGHIKKWVTIFKASHNIIDLIEVGDYVNGSKVYHKARIDTDDYGNDFKEVGIESDTYLYHWVEEKDIKSIVTKEQFESMSYKVKE